MSNHQLHLEPQFFENGNQPELAYLGLPNEDNHPQGKGFDSHQTYPHNSPPDPDAVSSTNRFYQEYRRIYSVSYNLKTERDRLIEVLNDLNQRIRNVDGKFTNVCVKGKEPKLIESRHEQHSEESKNKRARRTAEQIEKKFKCQVPFCERFYGSEGSLQQHIKLKHPQLVQKQSSDEYRPGIREKFDNSSN